MTRTIVTMPLAAALLGIVGAGEASAQDRFPFVPFAASLDFSEPETVAEFEAMVDEIGRHSFVYLDWHLRHAAGTEVFAPLLGASEAGAEEDLDHRFCERLAEQLAAGEGRVEFSGRPNPDNNHLLLTLIVRTTEDDPFAIARCEHAGSGEGPRIRGFFYVTEDRIATANRFELRPVLVDAVQVPAGFFAEVEP